MSCTIVRDNNQEIQEVFAPNENPSILYKDILTSSNDYSKEGKENALRIWAKAYTPSFKKVFGDWELIAEAQRYTGRIVGMYKKLFINDPQQVLFEASVQSHSSKLEHEGIVNILGENIVDLARELYPNAKVGQEYKPAVSKVLDINGEPLAKNVMTAKEKQQFAKIEVGKPVNISIVDTAERLAIEASRINNMPVYQCAKPLTTEER